MSYHLTGKRRSIGLKLSPSTGLIICDCKNKLQSLPIKFHSLMGHTLGGFFVLGYEDEIISLNSQC